MRKPYVEYQADDVTIDFIRHVAGSGSQELMIGCEVLLAAGLVSRELTLIGRDLTMKFIATSTLANCLERLTAPDTTRK